MLPEMPVEEYERKKTEITCKGLYGGIDSLPLSFSNDSGLR